MTSAFREPGVEPTPERIQAALGPAGGAWQDLARLIADAGLDLTWKYYRDGGWLARATSRGKTIAWLKVADGHATLTCYFAERHRPVLVADATLPAALRETISGTAMIGRMLPVTVEVREGFGVAEAGSLLGLKLAAR